MWTFRSFSSFYLENLIAISRISNFGRFWKNAIANEKRAIFNGFSLETWRNNFENPIRYLKSWMNFVLELFLDFWAIFKFLSRKFGCNISNLKLWQIWQNIEYFSKIGRFWTQNCPYKGCSRWKMEAIYLKGNLKSFSDLFSDFPLLSQFLRYTLISTYRFWPLSHLFTPITPISRRFAAERW